MTDNYIQLNNEEVVRLKIKTSEGVETGEELVFNLDDIELPLVYQDMLFKIQKAREKLVNDFVVIDKRQDIKGKKLLTKNEEDKVKAFNEFTNKMIEAYNMFLGENGVQKLLNGRKLGWTTMDEIDAIIGDQILPKLDISMERITEKVKQKYMNANVDELK